MKTDVLFGAVLAAILVVPPAVSQEAAQSSEEEASSSAETQQENAPAASQSSGVRRRRDPFRTLVVQRADDDLPDRLPPGKAGLVIGQLQVQGIASSIDGTWIALVENNTGIAYFLREGDQLYNGTVSAINPDRVVFMEVTTNARGQKITREVIKRIPV